MAKSVIKFTSHYRNTQNLSVYSDTKRTRYVVYWEAHSKRIMGHVFVACQANGHGHRHGTLHIQAWDPYEFSRIKDIILFFPDISHGINWTEILVFMPEVKPFLLRMNVNTVKLYDSKKKCQIVTGWVKWKYHSAMSSWQCVKRSYTHVIIIQQPTTPVIFKKILTMVGLKGKNKNFQKLKKYNKVGFRCDDFPYEWKQLITKYNFFKKVDKSSMYI